MDTDLHILVTSDQKDLIQEATVDAPEGMAEWARAVLIRAARRKIDQKASSKQNEQSPERTFAELARQWKARRSTTSTVKRMASHPAHRQIIEMGPAALPFILAEVGHEPDHWFIALHEITQANPVPETSRGKIAEMATPWIAWGKEHGNLQ